MLKKLVPGLLCATVISAVAALPVAAADVETNAQVCAGCHGQDGKPVIPNTPIIWGQQANYLYKELHDYHSGARANEVMGPIAKNFTLAELRDIANYFAAKTAPTPASAAAAATMPQQANQCLICHGKSFEGGAPAPRLAGLGYDYLIAQMNAFADGKRTNNEDMPKYMKALTSAQREEVAHYIAGL
ncbi:MAG TPA: c-type cytochrome [Beijerinckiaceae bacterium]|jgi:cytochrome c553|nr:c-type cytochrome [Beijerinckiaceae bacterium]